MQSRSQRGVTCVSLQHAPVVDEPLPRLGHSLRSGRRFQKLYSRASMTDSYYYPCITRTLHALWRCALIASAPRLRGATLGRILAFTLGVSQGARSGTLGSAGLHSSTACSLPVRGARLGRGRTSSRSASQQKARAECIRCLLSTWFRRGLCCMHKTPSRDLATLPGGAALEEPSTVHVTSRSHRAAASGIRQPNSVDTSTSR